MGHDENEKRYVTDFSLPSAGFTPAPSSLDAWNKDINRLHFGKDLDSCMKTLACIVDEYDSKQMDHLQCKVYHLALDWLQTLKDRLEDANQTIGAIHGFEFSTMCADSDDNPVPGTEQKACMMYNTAIITDEEAEKLLSGMCSPDLDDRVIVMRPAQARNLFPGLHKNDSACESEHEEHGTEDDQDEH